MKNIIVLLLFLGIHLNVEAQFVATVEMTEEVEGVCNQEQVFVLFGMLPDQDDAVCPLNKEKLLLKLNEKVEYLKNNPKYKSKGSVDVLVNCTGEVLKIEVHFKKSNNVLENQIEEVFRSLGSWKPGKLNGKAVDSQNLFSFKIKKGKISYD